VAGADLHSGRKSGSAFDYETDLGHHSSLTARGKNLEANGHASADSWTKALDFLEKHPPTGLEIVPASFNKRASLRKYSGCVATLAGVANSLKRS